MCYGLTLFTQDHVLVMLTIAYSCVSYQALIQSHTVTQGTPKLRMYRDTACQISSLEKVRRRTLLGVGTALVLSMGASRPLVPQTFGSRMTIHSRQI